MAAIELLQIHTLLYSALEEVSAEHDVPAALRRERKKTLFVGYWFWGGGTGPFWILWKGEKILSPTKIHSTIARLSSHYPSYCTNRAICSNTYQFIS